MMSTTSDFIVKEVTPETWADFEALFAAKGSPSYCWCMAQRAMNTKDRASGNAAKRQAMKDRVDGGVPVGLLGYLHGEPVAWCSVAPKPTYRSMRSGAEPRDDVWSIVCFFIRREQRGHGLSQLMLDAAVDHAKLRGAAIVEAYPVDEDSTSYRFMGFVPMFSEAGFHEVERAGARRHVMQLQVKPD